MFSIELRGCKELQQKVNKAEKGLIEFLTRDMEKACIIVENQVRINVSGATRLPMEGGGVYSQPYLRVRGGHLRSAYTHKVEMHGTEVIGRVGTPYFVALVHEFGKTIVAKAKPYLMFPIRIMGALGRTTKAGPAKPRYGKQWVRVRQVHIPARHPLQYAGELKKKEVIDMIGNDFGLYIKGQGL